MTTVENNGVRLTNDKYTLHPIVEILQANDRRVLPLVNANFGASIVCTA